MFVGILVCNFTVFSFKCWILGDLKLTSIYCWNMLKCWIIPNCLYAMEFCSIHPGKSTAGSPENHPERKFGTSSVFQTSMTLGSMSIFRGEKHLFGHVGVSKNNGTPKSSILIGFSIINHPFWGTPIFGNTHVPSQIMNHETIIHLIVSRSGFYYLQDINLNQARWWVLKDLQKKMLVKIYMKVIYIYIKITQGILPQLLQVRLKQLGSGDRHGI